MKIIQITNTYKDDVLDIVKSNVPDGFAVRTLPENTEAALLDCVSDADYILSSGRVRIDSSVLQKAERLKMIQRTGVGLDSIDLDGLKAAGIPLYVNRGVNAQSVAEHALLLMLSCLRNAPEISRNLKNGIWDKQKQGVHTRQLAGKTVGIIGMGHIGSILAGLLEPFHTRVLYSSRTRLPAERERALSVTWAARETLYREADIISLNCPLTEETRHLICRNTLAQMKPGVVIINTARGGLICEADLLAALQSGQVGAAGLDVFEKEPVPAGNPLLQSKQVICTPHIGGITYESFNRMMHDGMRNIRLFEEGRLSEIEEYRYRG